MLYKNEDAFAKDYKSNKRYGAYLLHGSENYLIERWTQRLLKEAEEDSAFNLHRFDGKKLDLDNVFEAVEALPLMAQHKYVYIDDLDYPKLPASDQKKLEDIVEDLPPDCTLIVSIKSTGSETKPVSKKLVTLFDRGGCTVELGSRGAGGLLTYLKSIAKKNGCVLSTEVGKYILQIGPPDMVSLRGEMQKVCAYVGEGEITPEQVDAIVIPRTEARIFDLQKKIMAGDTQGAMTLLDDLFFLRESPIAILGVLIRAYADLYRAKAARDNGASVSDVVSLFGYGREFLVRNAFSGSSNLSAAYLRQALDILYRCDRALKSTGVDDRTLVEQAVIQLFTLDKKQAV